MIANEQIQIFRSLFKGREDVFALRWERANKSGYMPAYSYDPYMYRLHKQKGGTFKDYKDKIKEALNQINEKLNFIKNNGRQSFLETKSENFSKIIHDYNDDQKGFYKWKNALEERLL